MLTPLFRLGFFGVLLSPCCQSAWHAAVDARDVRPPKLTYERLKLPNGLTVLLHQDRSTPIAHVSALVSRRVEGRANRAHRLCASVRTHDVQGLEERRSRSSTPRSCRRSAVRPTPTRPRTRRCSGRRCRRSTCRWCCGWRRIAWPRCASTTARSATSAKSSRKSAGCASRTSRTGG